ncbi:MAG: hypothetical protein R2856_07760 [Caldilineaceae bacterium]
MRPGVTGGLIVTDETFRCCWMPDRWLMPGRGFFDIVIGAEADRGPIAPRLEAPAEPRLWRQTSVRAIRICCDAFLVCLAPMIELRFERLFGYSAR